MATRPVIPRQFVRTKFLHSFLRERVEVTVRPIPMIVAGVEEVLDLIVLNHRFTAFNGSATASAPSLKRVVC